MRVGILGVPLDLGASLRGTDMGPSAIRYAGLADALGAIGHTVTEFGNVTVPVAGQIHGGRRCDISTRSSPSVNGSPTPWGA